MPTLEFKGKPFVYSHHLSVPFRELIVDPKKSMPPHGQKPSLDDNLIVHGDNLEALKALLPRYAGKIDVIYIDPPYNTGNEGWAYNDNVNSPLMKEWLGKAVDRDDLERHDKWLCMMWPRVELLYELLSDTGFLFVSLDDNELANFISLADEIFGDSSFAANIVVESNKRGQTYGELAKTHEYLLVYRKFDGELKELEADTDKLPFGDERGGYDLWELRNRNPKFNRVNRPNLYYPFYLSAKPAPDGQHRISLAKSKDFPIEVFPTNKEGEDGCWRWSREKIAKCVLTGNAPDVVGKLNRNDKYVVLQRSRRDVTKVKTIWSGSQFLNEAGTTLLGEIGIGSKFQFPKPVALIEQILRIASESESLVLDSFAGSATTAHAVLSLNQEDGGHRRFILVEAEQYADNVTAERIRRVIRGVPKAKNPALKKGLGGSFTYCDLGEALDLDRFFDGKSAPTYEQVARYIVYTATGQSALEVPKEPRKDWLVSETAGYRIHLIYKPDLGFMRGNDAALSLPLAREIAKGAKGKPVLVYAATKFLAQKQLTEAGITFCQLPYSVHRVLGEAPDAP
jgi:adenine-specific DNA-methyltransferase